MGTLGLTGFIMFNQTQGFINGEWRDSISGDTFDVRNPFNDELIETIADCGIEDAELAIDEASKAFKVWRKTTPKVRSGYLRKIGDLLLANKEELAALMTKEHHSKKQLEKLLSQQHSSISSQKNARGRMGK